MSIDTNWRPMAPEPPVMKIFNAFLLGYRASTCRRSALKFNSLLGRKGVAFPEIAPQALGFEVFYHCLATF